MTSAMEIRAFLERDEASVIELWRRCGLVRPWNDPRKDIRRKLEHQSEMFLVGILDDMIEDVYHNLGIVLPFRMDQLMD